MYEELNCISQMSLLIFRVSIVTRRRHLDANLA